MRTAASLLFAFALASCADVRWQKAGADQASLAQDLSACSKQAQAMYGAPGTIAPSPIDPRFGPTGPSPAAHLMQESEAVGQCMRQRGYVLVPIDK